jgi:hypothetical protein
MAGFVEDAHGAFPRVASRIEVTGGAVGFAEAGENAGFEAAVAEFTSPAKVASPAVSAQLTPMDVHIGRRPHLPMCTSIGIQPVAHRRIP